MLCKIDTRIEIGKVGKSPYDLYTLMAGYILLVVDQVLSRHVIEEDNSSVICAPKLQT